LSVGEVGGPVFSSDVKMKPGSPEVNVSGGVGEVQVHVSAALRHLRGDVGGGDDKWRFGPAWPEGSQLIESFESIHVLDFDCELLRLLRGIDLDQGVGTNRSVPMELGLPLQDPSG